MTCNISNFKEKINHISDIIFSLTFLFNGLQNKLKTKNAPDSENEKEFIDIKKNLLEITTEISEIKSILLKISLENNNEDITTPKNISNNNSIIKNTNQSINLSEEIYNITKENNKEKNEINSLLISQTLENSSSDINQISLLKEKLKKNEKKLLELKNIYESDIESRNLIEKLLKKNLEENKI